MFLDDKDASVSEEILKELENIDGQTDKVNIPFVRIDDDSVAKEFGILDELPVLVYFENKVPSVYEGKCFRFQFKFKNSTIGNTKILVCQFSLYIFSLYRGLSGVLTCLNYFLD